MVLAMFFALGFGMIVGAGAITVLNIIRDGDKVLIDRKTLERWSYAMETAEEWMQHSRAPGTSAYADVVDADRELRSIVSLWSKE